MQSGKSKFGRFLFFIGLILLVIFFAIDQSQNPAYGYFCGGIIVVILAVLLMRSGAKSEPTESLRFRTLRRWREQQKQRKADRKKKPYEP
jgi:peptidoglycan/LPS O-acetylase OafA/YrhL